MIKFNQLDKNIKFMHYRAFDETQADPITNPNGIDCRGGATVGYVEGEGKVKWAAAYCSKKDNFSRKLGRLKAAAHITNNSQRVEEVEASDRREFESLMDKEMFAEFGYVRL